MNDEKKIKTKTKEVGAQTGSTSVLEWLNAEGVR
jgi:hypothetical protein